MSFGAVQSMISSLKNNEKMRSKRTKFNTLGGNNSESKTEYNFPEATPEMLKKLRERLQKEQRQQTLKQVILMGISLIIIVVFLVKYA